MTLPVSGAISFNAINVELGVAGTTQASLGQASYRTLAGVPSGTISLSNFYGKANQFTFAIASNQTNADLRTLAINAGWNQSSAVVATVNAGVYIYSTSTGTAGLTISGSWPGGVTLVNNGYIMGMGGKGGGYGQSAGYAGGNAISLGVSCSITNNSYIGGGGGGGAGVSDTGGYNRGGGGGAGGGAGGDIYYGSLYAGGAGGGAGSSGSTGTYQGDGTNHSSSAGGGGGRIMPGTGGAGGTGAGTKMSRPGQGGGAGGGGGMSMGYAPCVGGAGGSGGDAAATPATPASFSAAAGGGGGWGASGGPGVNGANSSAPFGAPGAGGKAVALNGYSVTWNATGTRYGAIA